MKDKLTADRARPAQVCPSPLVPLKQIPCRNLVLNACEFVAPAVGHDNVVVGLEDLRVMHHLAHEELRRVRRGFVDHHGHALDLHALHDALDAARAEVIGVGLLVAYADVYLEALDCNSLIGRSSLTNNAYSPSLTS